MYIIIVSLEVLQFDTTLHVVVFFKVLTSFLHRFITPTISDPLSHNTFALITMAHNNCSESGGWLSITMVSVTDALFSDSDLKTLLLTSINVHFATLNKHRLRFCCKISRQHSLLIIIGGLFYCLQSQYEKAMYIK